MSFLSFIADPGTRQIKLNSTTIFMEEKDKTCFPIYLAFMNFQYAVDEQTCVLIKSATLLRNFFGFNRELNYSIVINMHISSLIYTSYAVSFRLFTQIRSVYNSNYVNFRLWFLLRKYRATENYSDPQHISSSINIIIVIIQICLFTSMLHCTVFST